jgi:hypothetical protein
MVCLAGWSLPFRLLFQCGLAGFASFGSLLPCLLEGFLSRSFAADIAHRHIPLPPRLIR